MEVTYETIWEKAVHAVGSENYQIAIDNGFLCLNFLNEQVAVLERQQIMNTNTDKNNEEYSNKKNFLLLKMLPCCILMSKSYILSNKKEEGSRFLSQSVLLAKKKLYKDPAENAAIFSVLAEVFKILKDNKGEHSMLVEYMQRMEKEAGKSHVAVSDCYHLLAGFYIRTKQINLAIEYGEKCLANRLDYFGRVNEIVDNSLYSLGLIYRAGGRLKDAFLTLLESIEIRTQLFGPTSLETAESQESAGFTAHQMKELKKANILYKLALETRTTILGKEHDSTKSLLKLQRQVYVELTSKTSSPSKKKKRKKKKR